MTPFKKCSVAGCDRNAQSKGKGKRRGLCKGHRGCATCKERNVGAPRPADARVKVPAAHCRKCGLKMTAKLIGAERDMYHAYSDTGGRLVVWRLRCPRRGFMAWGHDQYNGLPLELGTDLPAEIAKAESALASGEGLQFFRL